MVTPCKSGCAFRFIPQTGGTLEPWGGATRWNAPNTREMVFGVSRLFSHAPAWDLYAGDTGMYASVPPAICTYQPWTDPNNDSLATIHRSPSVTTMDMVLFSTLLDFIPSQYKSRLTGVGATDKNVSQNHSH